MSDGPNKDIRTHFRKLISGGQEKAVLPETDGSPLTRLPKAPAKTAQMKTPSVEPAPVPPASTQTPPKPAFQLKGFKFGPAFWTVTGLMSLIVNGILIAVMLIGLNMLGLLQSTTNNVATNLVGGLYTNFEKMDRASIVTSIPVDAQIPLSLNVPVQRTTEITLAQDAVISGARVRINTASIDIDAPANVTLPAGTKLVVALNFDLQVQDNIPIHVDVPVNIPLVKTDLHEPFAGLQDVIRPLYCLISPNALNLSGAPVCP